MSAAALEVVDPRSVWPLVRARAARSGLVARDLEAVLARCGRGHAVCMAGRDGVVVLAPRLVKGTMSLWVLLAVSTGVPGAFARHEQAMVEVARAMDVEQMIFHSRRRGWARMLGARWRFDGEYYARDV